MKQKLGPYVLLGSLFVILVFIVGVRYGKNVEGTDKVIQYVMSLTPTKPPEPTQPLSFKTFKNEGCGVQFLYPETLKVDTNASAEARLMAGKAEAVLINCNKTNPIQAQVVSPDQKLATEEVKLKNQIVKARIDPEDSAKKLYFQTRNPVNGKLLFVAIDKNYFPLFESTLQFTR